MLPTATRFLTSFEMTIIAGCLDFKRRYTLRYYALRNAPYGLAMFGAFRVVGHIAA
jgi:hypothetical protein